MPDSYGNAKDFFDRSLKDGELSKKRDLVQYSNPSKEKPCVGDLVVFDGSAGNPYGHVAIISKISPQSIEIIQQNPGPFAPSRVNFYLYYTPPSGYLIEEGRLLGWLRMKN
jgi:surface antigen